jgi:hypothetical protein
MKRVIAALIVMAAPLTSHAFSLAWPVACTLGESCFIQNLADHDPSSAMVDFTCNKATYDGHDGTDIRLRNLEAMRAGVDVLAAADGEVIGTRGNEPDTGLAGKKKDRECGNGVHLKHADGYRTQYCHLKQGSVRVRTGQQVKAGDVLGQIGFSGATEFPHVHLGVWKNDIALDPFTGGGINLPCVGVYLGAPLWAKAVTYSPSALLNHGFSTAVPDKEHMRDTPISLSTAPPDSPALIYWFDLMNLRAGDVLTVKIIAPDGSVLTEKSLSFDKARAAHFGYIGKKNSSGKLSVGTYRAAIRLTRGEQSVIQQSFEIDVR